ncbi:RNA polymerase factor sigma-54 [Clostridium thailandense]|uniref:RNA polymerase factor sigma-54 n=1 Tax=Clostridium thailandense TaxID=2794346 RepID=A0A949X3Z2_9CLOT|nr:RNA polymerase factor sigma-54 [Clostridium thailandense]MBV7273168.1 RNA polymerase factor sigma-54 [Clostridium thailandense]MCH5136025.1 RNA polymerase factor sigma-54 [Clostridiaceae bacterium UIB06]
MDFGLSLTQEQKLIMTQEMQLSVKILQMSSFELQEHVEKELQENPVLDAKNIDTNNEEKNKVDYKELIKYFEFDNYSHHGYEKNDDEEISPFNFISEKRSLKEYLKEQIRDLDEKGYVKAICLYIIENIDERGYLDIKDEEISEELKISPELTDYCIKAIQSLEPDGIGARDLKECLKIQIYKKALDDEKIYAIIDNYLELLAENKYNLISKELGINVKEAQEYGDIIKSLHPKPSRGFYTGEEVKYITPDAYIKKIDDEYYIIMNDSILPKLSINEIYKEIIKKEEDKDAVEYVKEKLNSALFLIKSIQHRKSTIYRVLEKILELQKDYFDYGEEYLKPMTLREIAENLEMHESTISRAIRDKYIYTSRGTVKIKDLFTTAISSSTNGEDVSVKIIKKAIKDLIDKEDKEKPLSDQVICNLLNKEGMNISRRTVAKYREELGIKSSKGRKRF